MADKQEIIDRLIQNTAEIITPEEFKARLASGEQLTHYIGFEISGYVHIGQGIMSALVMKDLTDLGVKCTVWLADWHTWINNKLDGRLTTAKKIGKHYFTEAIKATYLAVGGELKDIEFRSADDWYREKGEGAYHYMNLEKLIEHNTSLSRMQRSISIMGKQAGQEIDFAALTYPAMQVADIFYQGIDIAHAAMDQRKAHVIMRDVADKVAPGKPKPIALHHPLVSSLDGGTKMSKSRPDSAIFIHDSEEEIKRKITKAFAEEKNIEQNPILNWTKNILFWARSTPFKIERKPEHGGDVEFESYTELEKAYAEGSVHPMDLKAAVARELTELLAPVREHFAKPEIAAMKVELDQVLAKK